MILPETIHSLGFAKNSGQKIVDTKKGARKSVAPDSVLTVQAISGEFSRRDVLSSHKDVLLSIYTASLRAVPLQSASNLLKQN